MGIPSNIVDAAQQIKNGELGVIDVIKIGDVAVSALVGLQTPLEKEVTRRPVQAGFSVLDGLIDVSTDIVAEIILADPDFSVEAGLTAALTGEFAGFTDSWQQKRARLREIFDTREIITVITHEDTYPQRVITRIDPRWDPEQNWNCWIAQVVLSPFASQQVAAAADVAAAMVAGLQNVGGL